MKRNAHLVLALVLLAALTLIWARGEGEGVSGLDPTHGADSSDGLTPSATMPRGLPTVDTDSQPISVPTSVASRLDGLPGSCIDHHDLEGVPGVKVTCRLEGKRVGSAESDNDGVFQLRLSAPTFDEVRVDPPKGWWCVKHEMKRGEYQVRLARDNVSPLRAKLIDEVTGDPLPSYAVRLKGPGGWDELVTSDDKGLFTSETLFGAGRIALLATSEEFGPIIRRGPLAVHVHTPGGAEPPVVSIPVSGGATYFIDLENPGKVPLRRLGASISSPWDLETGEFYGGAIRGTTIHPGKFPWARIHWSVPNSEKPYLVVETVAGTWRGFARVDSSPGVHQAPVTIRLEPRVRLSGRVLNAEGKLVQGAELQLSYAGEGGTRQRARSSVLGLYEFESVRSGTHVLTAMGVREGRAHLELLVTGTDSIERDIHLEPYAVGGAISGRVRSLSSEYTKQTMVLLSAADTDSDLPPRSARVVWEQVGSVIEGKYEFDEVAAGEYHIWLQGVYSYAIEQESRTVVAGRGGFDFLIRDDVKRYGKRFLAMDKSTKKSLASAHLRLTNRAGELLYDGPNAEYLRPVFFANGEEFSWVMSCDGYESRSGNRAGYDSLRIGGHQVKQVPLNPVSSKD